jgi:hypothetical protein
MPASRSPVAWGSGPPIASRRPGSGLRRAGQSCQGRPFCARRWWPAGALNRCSAASGRPFPLGADPHFRLMAVKSDIATCLAAIRRLEARLDAAMKLPQIRISGGELRRAKEELERLKDATRPKTRRAARRPSSGTGAATSS